MCKTVVHSETSLGWGGQEIRILEEMKAMRDRGYRMILAAPEQSAIYPKAEKADFQVEPMSSNRLKYPISIFKLARFFYKEKVHIVNMHSSRDGYIAGIAARLAGVPLIIRTRHIDVDYPNKFISRFAFGKIPHHITTTSQLIAERLIHQLSLSPNSVSCIPTGIDLAKYGSVRGLDLELRKEFLSDGAEWLIGMVTVLRSWKGHRIFLEAIAEIKKDLPNVHYIIAGKGPMRDRIESWIEELELQDCVRLIGHRDDVPALLVALDLIVLPSYAHEGIPQIILQAQVSGTPVIGTTVGGIPEVIRHGSTGLLVEPKDPSALGQAIIKLARNSELCSHLGTNALKFALSRHSLRQMCEATEEVYQQYLD
ncbi:MAG: glycosyltransferase family 4 protein [Verrucomicrobiota bacterium]